MMIPVQLIGADEITEMDELQLKRRTIVIDDEREHTIVTEFWIDFDDARAVHRSVHVYAKRGIFSEAEIGAFQ